MISRNKWLNIMAYSRIYNTGLKLDNEIIEEIKMYCVKNNISIQKFYTTASLEHYKKVVLKKEVK